MCCAVVSSSGGFWFTTVLGRPIPGRWETRAAAMRRAEEVFRDACEQLRAEVELLIRRKEHMHGR